MSGDIYANADMSKKVRYKRNMQENKEEWDEREVVIYAIGDDHTDNQSAGGGPDTERHPPAVQRKTFRAAALCLAVLCFLMMTGLILLSVYFILLQTKHEVLQTRYKQLSNNNSQLQVKVSEKWCSDGWTTFGRSCYFKSKEKNTWDGSRADCREERGADLVVINNEEEQKFVSELNKDGESWIGLRNIGTYSYSEWKWVDGSPLRKTFWASGLTRNDDHLYAATCCDQQGKWKKRRYDDYKNGICEKIII
ncbi:CD209 antigen-like protein D [Perca flavescens]|uniref:CD209 antigen-like protein D n=1 Tax=Perca flavescens TaxID=8167 RepID=UPI00106E5FA8|nr:CD209 antigen-like protein D [Perca flavescens]